MVWHIGKINFRANKDSFSESDFVEHITGDADIGRNDFQRDTLLLEDSVTKESYIFYIFSRRLGMRDPYSMAVASTNVQVKDRVMRKAEDYLFSREIKFNEANI